MKRNLFSVSLLSREFSHSIRNGLVVASQHSTSPWCIAICFEIIFIGQLNFRTSTSSQIIILLSFSSLSLLAGLHCRARTRLQYKLQTESPALRVYFYFLLVVHSTACRWDWINANGERRERMQTETLIYYDNVSEANLNCLHFLLPSFKLLQTLCCWCHGIISV